MLRIYQVCSELKTAVIRVGLIKSLLTDSGIQQRRSLPPPPRKIIQQMCRLKKEELVQY